MRRRRIGISLTAAVLLMGGFTACRAAPVEPTLATVNFTPKLLIEIGLNGLTTAKGPRDDSAVSLNPTVVGSATVLEITNATLVDHRLQGDGGKAFDTGTLRPGVKTTVVLTNTTADDKTIAVTDVVDPAAGTLITIRAKPAT